MRFFAWRTATALGLVGLLIGCARVSETSLLLFSTLLPATLVVDGQLLQGDMQLLPDRTGTMTVRSQRTAKTLQPSEAAPLVSCVGQLRYSATMHGVIDLRCNAGVETELRFNMLSATRGYAYGQTPQGPVSATFGLNTREARAYLTLPPGKQLVDTGDSYFFELR
ncbi:hypothetical protein [Rhodoferax aquaticus]|uniref:Lipoprotein n=1 Tax=Rhodoferax aquaticus TaxID=2527691 RepID=A0A515EP29_9BURK|nr:hypothetical protein [Rhodoferax aquaticus]QDL54418.1 hypothetical protein EXZ61_09720 [Rhodoferax aquaticus]